MEYSPTNRTFGVLSTFCYRHKMIKIRKGTIDKPEKCKQWKTYPFKSMTIWFYSEESSKYTFYLSSTHFSGTSHTGKIIIFQFLAPKLTTLVSFSKIWNNLIIWTNYPWWVSHRPFIKDLMKRDISPIFLSTNNSTVCVREAYTEINSWDILTVKWHHSDEKNF